MVNASSAPRSGLSERVNKDILAIVLPVIAENVFQMLAQIVTSAMIGRLATEEIAAQGIGNRMYNLCWAAYKGIGIGATVVISLRYGRGQFKECRRAVEQTYLTLVPFAALVSLIFTIFSTKLVTIMSDDPTLVSQSSAYLRIVVWALPIAAINLCSIAGFNGHGNTKTPMFNAMFLNAVNVVAGYVLIFGIGPFKGYGLIGAGLATLISQSAGAFSCTWMLYHKKGYLREESHGLNFFKPERGLIREIYKSGLPAAGENVTWQLSAIVLSKIILTYGSATFAAYQLGLQAEVLCEMPGMGFVTAAVTLSARAIGQSDEELYRAYYKKMKIYALCTGLFTASLLFFFPGLIMQFLTDKPDVRALGTEYVLMMALCPIPQDQDKIYFGYMRSAGYPRQPFYFSVLGIWGVRVPVSMIFGWLLHWDIKWIWLSMALDQWTRLTASYIFFKRKRVLDKGVSLMSGNSSDADDTADIAGEETLLAEEARTDG